MRQQQVQLPLGIHSFPGADIAFTSWLEEAVSCNQHTVKHRLTKQKVSHPLRDDYINLLRELDGLHHALDDGDDIGKLHAGWESGKSREPRHTTPRSRDIKAARLHDYAPTDFCAPISLQPEKYYASPVSK